VDAHATVTLSALWRLPQGAINPLKSNEQTGEPEFLVYPLPVSLDETVLDYKELSPDQVRACLFS